MSLESERPIVITGGSIVIDFANSFDPVTTLPGEKKFKQKDDKKKIKTITVTIGDDPAQTYTVSDGKCEIKIEYQ